MPTYVYECDKGHRFEELQTIHEAPLTECRDTEGPGSPTCGAAVRKVFGAVSVLWKGGAPTKKFHSRG